MTTEMTTFKIMGINDMQNRYNDFAEFSKSILKEKLDYGVIPWVSKPSLFKPGAEKLRVAYGLGVEITRTGEILNLEADFYDVNYLATIKDRNGNIIAQCEGSANTHEDKYRYAWVPADKPATKEEEDKLKALKQGKRSKPNGSWQWMQKAEASNRISLKNTIQKMAQKRAFVWAILMATGASEFFTQDVEDMGIATSEVIEVKEVKKEVKNQTSSPVSNSEDVRPETTKPRFNEPELKELSEKRLFVSSFTTAQDLLDAIKKDYMVSRVMTEKLCELWESCLGEQGEVEPEDLNRYADDLPF